MVGMDRTRLRVSTQIAVPYGAVNSLTTRLVNCQSAGDHSGPEKEANNRVLRLGEGLQSIEDGRGRLSCALYLSGTGQVRPSTGSPDRAPHQVS
jgi:hypothetical protein